MFGGFLKCFTYKRYKLITITRTISMVHINSTACLSTQKTKISKSWYSSITVNGFGHSKHFIHPSPFPFLYQTRYNYTRPKTDYRVTLNNPESYTELYLIHNIRFFRFLGRLSKYSVLAFAFGSPVCIAALFAENVSNESLKMFFSYLIFYTVLFTGQSLLFSSRLVAKIMISPNKDLVKVSHFTIFGNRKDLYINPEDIIKFKYYGAELTSKSMVIMEFKKPAKSLIFFPNKGGMETNYEAIENLFCRGPEGEDKA